MGLQLDDPGRALAHPVTERPVRPGPLQQAGVHLRRGGGAPDQREVTPGLDEPHAPRPHRRGGERLAQEVVGATTPRNPRSPRSISVTTVRE